MTVLGIKAHLLGYKIQFVNAATLAGELKEACDSYQLCRLEKDIAANELLLINEPSYARFNQEESETAIQSDYRASRESEHDHHDEPRVLQTDGNVHKRHARGSSGRPSVLIYST